MKKNWTTRGFDAFRRGKFGNSGQNLYVSRAGVLQRIYQNDIDRDGYFDLVFANCQNHHEAAPSYVYDADGSCTKLPVEGALCACTADLTGDGYDDIILPGHDALGRTFVTAEIYYGGPDGYSENRHIQLPAPYTDDVCCGDFLGCGKKALVFAIPLYGIIRVFYPTELGYEWDHYTDLPIRASLIASADLDGDGFDDLIVRDGDTTETKVYWGGPGGLNVRDFTKLAALPKSEVLQPEDDGSVQSDMERKHDLKFLLQTICWNGKNCFTLSTGKYLMLYSALGRIIRREARIDIPLVTSVAVGDLDGDGYDDLAVASLVRNPDDKHRQCSFILWGGRDGFDQRPRTVIDTAMAADVDICGNQVLFGQCAAGRSYHNDSLLFTYPDFGNPKRFGGEDVRRCSFLKNPAGKLRILLQNHNSRSAIGFDSAFIYTGGPDGFSPDRMLEVPGHCAVDSLVADLNDDGWAEVLIANNSENSTHLDVGHHIHYFGPNGFEPERTRTLPTDLGWGVITGDFNHDGYLEIVTPSDHWENLRIYYGKDDFKTYETIYMNGMGSPRWISAADVNGDGWLDLIVPIITSDRSVILWGGPEGYSLERSMQLAVRHGVHAQAADLNGNGYPDVIIGSYCDNPKGGQMQPHEPHNSFVYIYWNGPEGLSEDRKCIFPADAVCSISVADFNNDGTLDIFAASYRGAYVRETPSFIYWNRNGHFSANDRKPIYTHSASGCVAADFNRDGYVDLAVANHKVFGDHHGESVVWWNGPDGFNEDRCTKLPTEGPHGMTSINPGNIMDRSESEWYESEVCTAEADGTVTGVEIEADIPDGTAVIPTLRVNGGEWQKPEGLTFRAGDKLQYRLEIKAELCLRTPRITAVTVNFA